MSDSKTVLSLWNPETKENRISSMTFNHLLDKLRQIELLSGEIFTLKNRVWILETPLRQKAVLDLVAVRPRENHFLTRTSKATYDDFQEMMRLGLITEKRRGTHLMYAKKENKPT